MKKRVASLALAVALTALPSPSYAIDANKLPIGKRTSSGKYLSAKEAYKMKIKDPYSVLFIDVRTPAENEFVGIADEVDKVIPLKLNNHAVWDHKKERYGQYLNPNFVSAIDELVLLKEKDKATPIILMCRSGDRSAEGANLLAKNGYTNVYSIYDGFEGDLETEGSKKGRREVNGWKNSKLPWGYSLKQDRAYLVVPPAAPTTLPAAPASVVAPTVQPPAAPAVPTTVAPAPQVVQPPAPVAAPVSKSQTTVPTPTATPAPAPVTAAAPVQ
uniref:Rhodanese-like protein n=1 Tax=Chlorobium chlorochromatii (strain CaD3) TaxID=340177 RepID=Q3AS07_CHLCH